MAITANSTLREIGEILEAADDILLFPHLNPDADAIGSALGLCLALQKQGKRVKVLLDHKLPEYLQFMDAPAEGEESVFITDASGMEAPQISMCIDCSEDDRIPGRVEAFDRAPACLCIDHHRREDCSRDHYYIDPAAAASAQIVYDMIREMGWQTDERIAEALYIGLSGDTGNFMYSNTTPAVHRMAADLIELGADVNRVSVRLYQSKDPREALMEARCLSKMELLAGGLAAMTKMTVEDQTDFGLEPGRSDQMIDRLRDLKGIEVAAVVKNDGRETRVNLRAKNDFNVAEIAESFGGGGHVKAAGFRKKQPLDEVYEALKEAILARLGQEE